MTYLDQFETFLASLVAPIQAQLDDATAKLATATATIASDATTAAALQSTVDTLTGQVADLQKQLDAALHPVSPVTAAAGVWFPIPADINTHDKKVFAHYFGPYPRSLDNAATEAANYYTKTFNNPASTVYGGLLRDEPLYRAPLGSTWKIDDCTWDVQTAQAAGIDGFMVDLLGLSGSNWDNYMNLLTAARAWNDKSGLPPFYVVPMVDGTGASGSNSSTGGAATAAGSVAPNLLKFAAGNAAWILPNGRFVVSCFKMEALPVTWWQALFAAMKVPVAFLGASLNFSTAGNYTAVTWGEGSWGDGDDPAIQKAQTNKAAASHSRGKVYMQPVGGQNVRPNQHVYDEAANTEAERASWERAIADQADYVQMVTWSDFSEGTQYTPSQARGYAPLDLATWYITKFKTGTYPPIVKDAVILSHRSAPIGAKPSGPQTQFMAHWNRGGPTPTAPRDTVEALTFLTAPATVTITAAGQATTYDAPAGMFAQLVPLGIGPVSVSAVRAGAVVAAVTSPVVPVKTPIRDDAQYFWASSTRGTAGQKAPVGP